MDFATITVSIRNENYVAQGDIPVTLSSSRGLMDEISPLTTKTNSSGKAQFVVRSLKNGTSTYSAAIEGFSTFNKTVDVVYSQGLELALPVGSLVKIPDDNRSDTLSDTAVYYYASNGKRYVFPNEPTYFSWYNDFGSVQTISLEDMSKIPIGGNVTYRPGSYLVKFQTDVKTYLPTKGGVLRWVTSEEIAKSWFGSDWNTAHTHDISEAFFINYTIGEPVYHRLDASPIGAQSQVTTINQHLGL